MNNGFDFLGDRCASFHQECTQCKNVNHNLLDVKYNDRVPAGVNIVGTVDCFDPSELPDYFYVSGIRFLPCKDKCKKCTSATDCQECGSFSDTTKVIYLLAENGGTCVDTCDLSSNRYQLPPGTPGSSNCIECPAGTFYKEGSNPPGCVACNAVGEFLEEGTKVCKDCGTGCGTCTSTASCQSCKISTDYIQLDGGTCAAGCNSGTEIKQEIPQKRCVPCPSTCTDCDVDAGCRSCQPPNKLQNRFICNLCPDGCQTCPNISECTKCINEFDVLGTDGKTCSTSCKAREYADTTTNPNQKICKPCPDNCSICNMLGCLVCDPNYYLLTGECKYANLVNYAVQQFYNTKINWTFTLKITMESQFNLTYKTYQELEKNILDYQDKFNFELIDKKKYKGLTFEIVKGDEENEFFARISLDEITGLALGKNVEIQVQSFSKPLDPERTDPLRLFSLIQRSQTIKLEVFKLTNEPLSTISRSAADIFYNTQRIAYPTTLGLGILFALASEDKGGIILKFNQFLTLLKKVKMVNIFFGKSLGAFIELVSGEKNRKESALEKHNSSQSKRRTLEVSIDENQRHTIDQESNASHGKLDLYQQTIFFEGAFMIKSVVYIFSWILKLVGIVLMAMMKKKKQVSSGKLKFLKYQRKIHQTAMMVAAMDILFFGTRIILHRKISTLAILIKGLALLNITLLFIDFLTLVIIGIRLTNHDIKLQEDSDAKEGASAVSAHMNRGMTSIMSRRYFTPGSSRVQQRRMKFKNINSNRFKGRNPRKKESQSTKKHAPHAHRQNESMEFLNTPLHQADSNNQNQSNKQQNHNKRLKKSRKKELNIFNQNKKNKNEKKNMIAQKNQNTNQRTENTQKDKKDGREIDIEKTLNYNSRNIAIEEFLKALLTKDKNSYSLAIMRLSNFLNVLQLALLQICMAGLPHSPTILIILLICMELIFMLLTVLPYLLSFRFVSLLEVLTKITKFVCLEIFYFVCLVISLSARRHRRPVSTLLQIGIISISTGIFTTYVFTIIKVVLMVAQIVKKKMSKKKEKDKGENGEGDDDKEQLHKNRDKSGLIFYKSNQPSTKENNMKKDAKKGGESELDGMEEVKRQEERQEKGNPFKFLDSADRSSQRSLEEGEKDNKLRKDRPRKKNTKKEKEEDINHEKLRQQRLKPFSGKKKNHRKSKHQKREKRRKIRGQKENEELREDSPDHSKSAKMKKQLEKSRNKSKHKNKRNKSKRRRK